MVERDARGRLKPGSRINPTGRNGATKLRERLQSISDELAVSELNPGMTFQEALVRTVWDKALSGDASWAKLLLEREWPAVKELEMRVPGSDDAALGDRLADLASRKRANGRDPDAAGNGKDRTQ